MAPRWYVPISAVLAAAALAAWLHAGPNSSDAPLGAPATALPEIDTFYAVEISGCGGSFDLPLDRSSRYELIVSSLGQAEREYRVKLSAQRCLDVEDKRWSSAFRRLPTPGAGGAGGRPPAEMGIPTTAPHPRPVSRGEWGEENRGWERGEKDVEWVEPCEAHRPPAWWASLRSTHPTHLVPRERRFFLHVTTAPLEDEHGYVPVVGVVSAEGEQVRVYVDRELSSSALEPGLAGEIIRLLEHQIIPRSRVLIGEHIDVDGDGKLAVLITDWLGRLRGGTTSVNGFVRSNDFRVDAEAPFGNRADVMYLNSAVRAGAGLKALLGHEYTHAVSFSRRLALPRPAPLAEEADWLSEGIAHAAEYEHRAGWSNLDQRIAAFLATPEKFPLVVRDYYRAGLWRDAGCRGATSLFLLYCVERFGQNLLSALVDGQESGKANLERATGMAFADLFRGWTIALADDRIGSLSLRGRLGDCALAGIKRIEWHRDREPWLLELRGTTMAVVRLDAGSRTGTLRVTVEADRGAALQIGLRRQCPSRPRVDSTLAGRNSNDACWRRQGGGATRVQMARSGASKSVLPSPLGGEGSSRE
jgi:hypothetical protein